VLATAPAVRVTDDCPFDDSGDDDACPQERLRLRRCLRDCSLPWNAAYNHVGCYLYSQLQHLHFHEIIQYIEVESLNPHYTSQHQALPEHPADESSHPPTTTYLQSNMGWFGASDSQPSPPPPAPSQDGGFIAPDRSARARHSKHALLVARASRFGCADGFLGHVGLPMERITTYGIWRQRKSTSTGYTG